MQVAIPVWNDRISPVFDSAGSLVVLEVESNQVRSRTEVEWRETPAPLKAKWLSDHNIDVLVCGAISRPFADMIVSSGVSIIPWVCGTFDEVVSAFLANALPHPQFTLPGCCGCRMHARHHDASGSNGARRRRNRGRGRGTGGRQGPAG